LLCSSSPHNPSIAPEDQLYTQFSGVLLDCLRAGKPEIQRPLSFYELGSQIRDLIRQKYPSTGVRPEVKVPDESEGDIAQIPFFPNAAIGAFPLLPSALNSSPKADARQDRSWVQDERRGSRTTTPARRLLIPPELWNHIPPSVQAELVSWRRGRINGLLWMTFSMALCTCTLLHNVFFAKFVDLVAGFLDLTVILGGLLSLVLLWRNDFRSHTLNEKLRMGIEPETSWEYLEPVVAMRTSRVFRFVGGLRVDRASFVVASIFYFLTVSLFILEAVGVVDIDFGGLNVKLY
jgi:hypothetical protein